MTAYDPATGQTSAQSVQHVWINHDTDLLDVTLAASDGQAMTRATDGTSKQQEVAVASHGLRAPPADGTATGDGQAPSAETIHTTANHPWLTADRGWVAAGQLTAGERVVRADGGTARVVGLRIVPGAGTMYNLTVSQLHTYAVGDGRYVVQNEGCGPTEAGSSGNTDYRGIARGENPADGFTARSPNTPAAEVSPASHVAGKNASLWISTTRDPVVAFSKYGANGVAARDLSLVDTPILDISNGIPGRRGQMISNWANRDSEVLIYGRVPPEAVVWWWTP